jgi:hypothetical protein
MELHLGDDDDYDDVPMQHETPVHAYRIVARRGLLCVFEDMLQDWLSPFFNNIKKYCKGFRRYHHHCWQPVVTSGPDRRVTCCVFSDKGNVQDTLGRVKAVTTHQSLVVLFSATCHFHLLRVRT